MTPRVIIGFELARRLEIAEALDGVDCAEACCEFDPACNAAVEAVAGGFCLFCGDNSPLTHALGIGLHGAVKPEEIGILENFFQSRGAPVVVDVTPYADPSLRDGLSQRGYRICDMNTVLVRCLAASETLPEPPFAVQIRDAEDIELYAHVLMRGFLGREEPNADELKIGRAIFHMRSGTPLLAWVDGEVAGGCGFSMRNGVASFFGDATLTRFRGRGVHTAMILERLRRAQAAGCDLATAGTQPGSTSQRNYQRLGFEVAYSKISMLLG